ncbi:MAG: DUF2304 domain-containing protein [Oribacterium parvum]|uniref:DUF2304 domain-containing protein n=1 Tax=Oribacterium parvum TaxID=1501329 RepID=UPI001CAFC867|nr:DUF2304 domain-containing protein [Oribacterium parvum]MBF1268476.1 DUF2304 domain-containing protein [Oribacterium parvum]
MTLLFRIILLAVCLFTYFFLHRSIKKEKMRIEESIFWLILSLLLLVFAIFPGIPDILARLLGIYSTANFLFLFVIFILLLRLFYVNAALGKLEERVKTLVQNEALRDRREREKDRRDKRVKDSQNRETKEKRQIE